jgi:thiamine phosphate synthase YjbQ (UPF0047 family)
MRRLVLTRMNLKHQHDTQGAAGHIKAAPIVNSRASFVNEGKLGLGHAQRASFWDFDGSRGRTAYVQAAGT